MEKVVRFILYQAYALTIQEVLKHGCISSQSNIHLYLELAKISTR
jgi:hypothetical protein